MKLKQKRFKGNIASLKLFPFAIKSQERKRLFKNSSPKPTKAE